MITLDLGQQALTVEELLQFASSDPVLIRTSSGREFILEPGAHEVGGDEFDREVALLGQSDRFMHFLADRSKEEGTISIEQLKRDLDQRRE